MNKFSDIFYFQHTTIFFHENKYERLQICTTGSIYYTASNIVKQRSPKHGYMILFGYALQRRHSSKHINLQHVLRIMHTVLAVFVAI